MTEDDADPEDLEVFYPTHQWQTIRPGNVLLPNDSVPAPREPRRTTPFLLVPMTMCYFAGVQAKRFGPGTGDHPRAGEWLLKCLRFPGAGRGAAGHIRGADVSLPPAQNPFFYFARLSRDRFYNIPGLLRETLLGGDPIQAPPCDTAQCFNNWLPVPWLLEIQLLRPSVHPTKNVFYFIFGWYLLQDVHGTCVVRKHWRAGGFAAKTPVLGRALERMSVFKHAQMRVCAHILAIRMISKPASGVLDQVFNPLVLWCPYVYAGVIPSRLTRVN